MLEKAENVSHYPLAGWMHWLQFAYCSKILYGFQLNNYYVESCESSSIFCLLLHFFCACKKLSLEIVSKRKKKECAVFLYWILTDIRYSITTNISWGLSLWISESKMEHNSFFNTSELSVCKNQTDWSILCTGENLHIAEINLISWKPTQFFFDRKLLKFTMYHFCNFYISSKNKSLLIVPLSKNKKLCFFLTYENDWWVNFSYPSLL